MLNNILNYRDATQNNIAWDKVTQSGKFMAAAMYKELRCESVDVSWKNIFFQNHASPRARFILWLTLKGRVPTKDKLVRFGFIQEKKCCFCSHDESMQHLFFDRVYTNRILRSKLEWNGYYRSILQWDQEQDWMIHETTKKGWRREILRISFAETVYEIWCTGNDAMFNHTQPRTYILNTIQERVVGRSLTHRKLLTHVNVSSLRLN